MTPSARVLDVNLLKTTLEKAYTENSDTVEVLRPFQRQLKDAGEESDFEDIYDNYICRRVHGETPFLRPEILLRVRSDMGGGRDFSSDEALIASDENRLKDILKNKQIVFDEAKLSALMKSGPKLYGGRVRKDGSLFYSHALKTALLFAAHGDDVNQEKVIVALLHDVIERGMVNDPAEVRQELATLQIDKPDNVTDLLASVAPTAEERAAIKVGNVTSYFKRINRTGLLAIILAEKLQNINDGRRLFLTRPADERGYVSTRLKPAVIRQYLEVGQATDMKKALLTGYLDLLYLTETYDASLDSCVDEFLKSHKESGDLEAIALNSKLDRLKEFQTHNERLNLILAEHGLSPNSSAYAHVRKAVTDAVLLLSSKEINDVFLRVNQKESPVEDAIDRFMKWFKEYGSMAGMRLINNQHCAVHLDIIGYGIIENATLSQRLVEGEEEVAKILKAVTRSNGITVVRKAPKEVIVAAGMKSDAVFLLLEGDAYVSFPSDRRRQEIKIGPDNTISSTSVRKGRIVAATVIAGETGVTLLRIPKEAYIKLCEGDSKILALLERTSELRRIARLRSERSPVANLDLVQCNTLREIIDVQDGWSYGTFDLLGNRTKRRVVFKKTANSRGAMSFVDISQRVTECEAEWLKNVPAAQRALRMAEEEGWALASKLRRLMDEKKLFAEFEEQKLSSADTESLGGKPGNSFRQLEEMLTVETAKAREHRQAIQLTLYENYENKHVPHPVDLFNKQSIPGLSVESAVQAASLDFIDQAIEKGFLYAAKDPDNERIRRFVKDLVAAIASNRGENIKSKPESFKKVIFSTLESLIVQQGGALRRDEDALWSFGTGGNRLRGSNGIMHVIANWRRGKAILEALQSSHQKLAEYHGIFCFAAAWHDANAGSIQEANTGSRFWAAGQSPDLKAGHGFAAVKYLDELRPELRDIFSDSGVVLIEKLVAQHDNGLLRFETPEMTLLSIAGISDNAASEEKVIEAFTKVPENAGVAVELFRLFERLPQNTTADQADEEMTPERNRMELNIAEAANNNLISTIQSSAYQHAIKADLTLRVGKLALESLGMHQSVSRVDFSDGVLTIRYTRSPLYAKLKTVLGQDLLQARVFDCVKEYRKYLPNLDAESDLATQDLSYQVPNTATGLIRKVVFKVEDAGPETKPHDYTLRVHEILSGDITNTNAPG